MYGEITPNSYKDIVFTQLSGSLPAMTLIFWSQKLITLIQAHLHLGSWLGKIHFIGWWDSVFTSFSAHCLLWPWPLDPKIYSAHQWTQIHLWPRLGEIPFIGFSDIMSIRFLGSTDSCTHSQRDRLKYNTPRAPFFNGGAGIIIKRQITQVAHCQCISTM